MPQEPNSMAKHIEVLKEFVDGIQERALKNKQEATELVRYMLKEELITLEDILWHKANIGYLVTEALETIMKKHIDNNEVLEHEFNEFMQRVEKL